MAKPPIWIDANVLIKLDQWLIKAHGSAPYAGYEAELVRLRADGHELLVTPQAKREVLFGGKGLIRPRDTLRRQQMLTRFGVNIDSMGNKISPQQIETWKQLGIKHGLSKEDATLVAEVKASAQARNVQNPVLVTRDAGGTLKAMRARGVIGVEFKVAAEKPAPSPPPPTQPTLQQPTAPTPSPVAPPARTPPTGGRITSIESITSRLGRLRAVARGSLPLRIAGGIAVNVIFALIGAYLQARANRKQIESDLDRIEKEVRAILAKKEAIDLIAKAQLSANSDDKVYAVFGIEVHHGQPRGPYWSNKRYDYPSVADISAWISPAGVQILALSDFQKRLRGGNEREKRNGMVIIETFFEFIEVAVYLPDEMNAYHDLEERYHALKNRSRLEPYNAQLADDIAKTKNAIVESFGSDVWFDW